MANRIAAGEVVERPASVVKELVENALDAGARRVEIQVESGGKKRIRVSDDGGGMGREDALLSLERHATSKISDPADLARIQTLGFRGEALPSIASVSRFTLETQEATEDIGTRVRARGGRIEDVEPHARSRGTTVEVERLFFNAPARAEFLRSTVAETRAISAVVSRAAASAPTVGFRLISDGRTLLDLAPARTLEARIEELWADASGTLIPVSGSGEGWEVTGLIQRPDATRPGFRRALLMAQGRPFRDAKLIEAVDRGYLTTIPPSHRPWVVLDVTGGEGGIDPNVHPAKEEVRFRDRGTIDALVEQIVRSALDDAASGATFSPIPEPVPTMVREVPGPEAPQQTTLFVSPDTRSLDEAAASDAAPLDPRPLAPSPPHLWQVHRTWILAEIGDGLLLIDQHSAHERILYQRIIDSLESAGEEGQRLMFPFTVQLGREEYGLIEDLQVILRKTGYEVEAFGGDTIVVHSAPNPHPAFDPERCLREMLAELAAGSDLTRSARNQHDAIAMTFACKGAIKAGQVLSQEEMRELVDRLFATPLPFHDVHGRPTIVRLTRSELERKFGRH